MKLPRVVAKLNLTESKDLASLSIIKKGKKEILIQIIKIANTPIATATVIITLPAS